MQNNATLTILETAFEVGTALNLSGLPKGMYALQARAEGQVFVKKVVVESYIMAIY
jgi:hypothetical protein